MADPSRGRRRLRPGWITAIATLVMAVVAVIAYLWPVETGGNAGPPGGVTTGPTGSPGSPPPELSAPPGGSGAPGVTSLADLTPVSGASRLAALPPELAEDSEFDSAVVISCPSNQTDDPISEVVYEARYRYSILNVELHPYRDPPDNVLVNLQVFSDPQDRDPGAQLPGDPHLTQVRAGERGVSREIAINEAYFLRLRVECEKPGGFLILTRAELRPAG